MENKGFYTDVVVALKDSIILWEFLAKTGRKDKIRAIIDLHKMGEMKDSFFFLACPLCEYSSAVLRRSGVMCRSRCTFCPVKWVDISTGYRTHCESRDSSYIKWYGSPTKAGRKKYAREVVVLLHESLSGVVSSIFTE